MHRLISSAAAMSLFIMVAAIPADAVTASLEQVIVSAQQSITDGQLKKAESSLKKALAAATIEGVKDANFAKGQSLYASVLRQNGKLPEAAEALAEAYEAYKKLGSVDPLYVSELKSLAPDFQSLELDILRGAAAALKNNAAKVTMSKSGPGAAHVQIKMPTPLENTLNNAKVDGVQLEKIVDFDLSKADGSSIHVSNIKGFRIHSVEKNTWVNLLDLTTGAVDAEGKYDATIVAGKAGITKTVAAKLPQKAADPIFAIAEQLDKFGAVPQIDLPVAEIKSAVAADAPTKPASVEPTTAPSTNAGWDAVRTSTPAVAEPAAVTPPAVTAPVRTSAPVVETPVVPLVEKTPAPVVETPAAPVVERPAAEPVAAPVVENHPSATDVKITPVEEKRDSDKAETSDAEVKKQDVSSTSSKSSKSKKDDDGDNDDDDDDKRDNDKSDDPKNERD